MINETQTQVLVLSGLQEDNGIYVYPNQKPQYRFPAHHNHLNVLTSVWNAEI